MAVTEEPVEIVLGSRRQRPHRDRGRATGEFDWDANWIRSEVEVRVGGFQGRFEAQLMTTDFPPFRDGLRALEKDLRGEVSFETLEEQVRVKVRGDGRGHINLDGELADVAGMGNRLAFHLEIDQTFLGAALQQLDALIEQYPIVGRSETTR